MFFAQMTSCFVHYDVIYYPFPVNSQYLKMLGVDSPGHFDLNVSDVPFSLHLLLMCHMFLPNLQTAAFVA